MRSLGISLETLSANRPTATTTLVLLPVVIPVAYVFYTSWTVYRNTTSVSGTLPSRDESSAPGTSHPVEPHSLPDEIANDRSRWVVAYEKVVSKPLLPSSLGYLPEQSSPSGSTTQPSRLLQQVSRAMHKAFSRTPQATIIRRAISEPLNKGSFDPEWIDNLSFKLGDIVNGVYKVSSVTNDEATGSERVELLIDIPPSYKGPSVRGLILAAIEPAPSADSDHKGAVERKIVFVNETWMWRPVDEKPTLLETSFGRWFHRLLAGWLVLKGITGAKGERGIC